MDKPSVEQLDNHRKEGFRPGVVLCLIYNKKVLMVYKKAHKLWQLPQGRIKNKEDPLEALERNVKEELGGNIAGEIDFNNSQYVDTDQMEFKPGRHKAEMLTDDSGHEMVMIGKVYYFVALPCNTDKLDISKTQFDEHHWMSYREADFIAERIYQQGKKRVTVKILKELLKLGLIE